MEIVGKCNSNLEFKRKISEYLENFNTSYEIIIWGTGKSCQILIDTIKNTHKIKYIVDIDSTKWKKKFSGISIESPEKLKKENIDNIRIMIMPYSFARYDIVNELVNYGFKDQNYCFGNDYFTLHNYKFENKIVLQNIGFFIGSACNLKCRDCIAHLPFYKENINTSVPFEKIKKDIDNLFSVVDYINLITLSTGEIFLHPELDKIIQYLARFKNKYNFIQTPINGTILPKKRILELMSKNNIGVYISDYSQVVGSKSKIPQVIEAFKKNNVKFEVFKDLQGGKSNELIWSDIGDFSEVRNRSDSETLNVYIKCANRSAQVFFDSKLYTCGSSIWGEFGGLYKSSITENRDYIDIRESEKIEILRTYYGATENGFPNVCRRCNGIGPYSNKKTVLAGIQHKEKK